MPKRSTCVSNGPTAPPSPMLTGMGCYVHTPHRYRHGLHRAVLRDLVKGWLFVRVHSAKNLPRADFLARSSDPYIVLSSDTVYNSTANHNRTATVPTNLNPEWKDETMCFFIRCVIDTMFYKYPANTTITSETRQTPRLPSSVLTKTAGTRWRYCADTALDICSFLV